MYIAPKTIDEIASSHPEGTRHAAMVRIAMPLLGDGMAPEAVIAQLRASFDSQKTDKEIADIVRWCVSKGPAPSGFGKRNGHHPSPMAARPAPRVTKKPQQLVDELLEGQKQTLKDWEAKSPVPIPEDPAASTILMLESLYGENEMVNLVKSFTLRDGKAQPQGGGTSQTRNWWVAKFRQGIPASESGVWMRPNPCRSGTGRDGSTTDADILSHRFLMVESDSLSVEDQLSVYAQLRLPIAVLVSSGGGSVHAWLKVDCADDPSYRSTAKRIYAVLGRFGFDPANKNPSRLSRLPGATRVIGAKGDGLQRLIYLDPNPPALSLDLFESASEPLEDVVRASTMGDRMVEYMRKKETPFTLPYFTVKTSFQTHELEGFYMRPAELTIWTGPTHHGKSSLLANVMVAALTAGKRIFVCSLEHQAEQLLVLLAQIGSGAKPNMEAINDCVRFFGPLLLFMDKVGEVSAADLFKAMRSVHARFGVEHFFIDSLMRISGLEENYAGQNDFVNGLQAIAKETGGHIHLVAHPRKIDESVRAKKADIRGSGLLTANADNVVSVRRNTKKQELREEGTSELELLGLHDTEVGIEKQRASGWLGLIRLDYDLGSKSFSATKSTKTHEVPARKDKSGSNSSRATSF